MRKEVTILISDISGEDATETVEFGFDGTTYEIDLTASEVADFRAAIEPYVDSARRTGGRRRRRPTRTEVAPEPGSKEERDAIRQWARKNGHEVNARARIPKSVTEAYYKAHQS